MDEWTGVAGKRVVMTGATNGIGLAAAEGLAARGAGITIVARSPERAAVAVERIREEAPDAPVPEVVLADLSSQAEVRRLAAELLDRHERIDVLVNNAGAMFRTRHLTVDGIEEIRIIDMSASKSWAEFADLFRHTHNAFLANERARTQLRALMRESAYEAIGNGVRAKRSRSGEIVLEILKTGDTSATCH